VASGDEVDGRKYAEKVQDRYVLCVTRAKGTEQMRLDRRDEKGEYTGVESIPEGEIEHLLSLAVRLRHASPF
jgi:hypothetical protein